MHALRCSYATRNHVGGEGWIMRCNAVQKCTYDSHEFGLKWVSQARAAVERRGWGRLQEKGCYRAPTTLLFLDTLDT